MTPTSVRRNGFDMCVSHDEHVRINGMWSDVCESVGTSLGFVVVCAEARNDVNHSFGPLTNQSSRRYDDLQSLDIHVGSWSSDHAFVRRGGEPCNAP